MRLLAVLLIIALCAASNLRARAYLDRRTLWADTLAKNPDSPMAHNNYAVELMHDRELEEAKAQFRAAMNLRPDAMDWVGLGQCFAIEGNFAAARDMYLKAIAATPDSPEPVFQRLRAGKEFQLGTAYQGLSRQATSAVMARQYRLAATQAYQRAIDLFPEYEDPRTNLAVLLIDENKLSEAIEQCQIVLNEDPESASAHTNLGKAFYAQGKLDAALAEYRRVLEFDPENADAMASVGAILAQQGHVDAGIAMLQNALTIDPHNATAMRNLLAAMNERARSRP
jgi:tetratricopeptide (TPR) repeat protein